MVYYLYVITGPTRQMYVGVTGNPKERWRAHRKNKADHPLYNAMREFGRDQFEMIVLKTFNTKEEVLLAEIDMIRLLGAQDSDHGFNLAAGGQFAGSAGANALRNKLQTEPGYFEAFSLRSSLQTKAQWAVRSPEEKQAVATAISQTLKDKVRNEPEFAALQRERMLSARAKGDVAARGRAASIGIKKFWLDLKSDPVRYADYIARRRATLLETIRGK